MKIIGTFAVVVVASVALLQPAQGRSHGGGRSFSSAPHFSAPARNFSGHSRSFSNSAPRYYHSSPRFSSRAVYRNRTSGARFSTAHNPRVYSASNARLSATRRAALRPQTFNGSGGRVLAQQTRNWDRGRDHFWNGHRCRWHHNSWVIIDPWFYPWGYGYYPYGTYSYYDDGYYDDGYATSQYSQEPSQSEYNSGAGDFSVSEVQSALARAGYYRGAIDGSLGPATRNALRRYQRDQGLAITGRIDRPVVETLGLR
jgi:hypothetical protein